MPCKPVRISLCIELFTHFLDMAVVRALWHEAKHPRSRSVRRVRAIEKCSEARRPDVLGNAIAAIEPLRLESELCAWTHLAALDIDVDALALLALTLAALHADFRPDEIA